MATGLPAYGVQLVCGLLLVTLAWRALGVEGFSVPLCIWFIRRWLARADWARRAPRAP